MPDPLNTLRDPRYEPLPGDIVTRTHSREVLALDGSYVVYRHTVGDGQPRRVSLQEWRAWANQWMG